MTNETKPENTIKISLEAIVKNETLMGFKVNGLPWTFDGDEHSGRRTYTVHPAGIDAPEVFKVIERGDLGWRQYDTTKETIVAGGLKCAMQKAYELALEYAQGDVETHNRWAEEEEKRGTDRFKRATLDDQYKK